MSDLKWEDQFAIPIADGIALHDVTGLMHRHKTKIYPIRKKKTTTLFFHHSGADNGLDGIDAFLAMARYHIIHKNWPGFGYHYGINLRPIEDSSGRLVVFRCGASSTVRAHTKLCNRFGEGAVLQGHHGKEPLSNFQIECLEAFIPWWCETFQRDYKKNIGWHSNSWKWGGIPKPACPGKWAVSYLNKYITDEV